MTRTTPELSSSPFDLYTLFPSFRTTSVGGRLTHYVRVNVQQTHWTMCRNHSSGGALVSDTRGIIWIFFHLQLSPVASEMLAPELLNISLVGLVSTTHVHRLTQMCS
ncbi:hypothetical protein AVEN_195876-1 [Araneus ventricosus]|uniref:Uncharacterized protein n=1 Tax=Araneus ventricosus TaxID=182803 RepID=A0A4Y2DTY7_ARAVE|nr:hypothetical protein AVEN_195876-1 [Araneus ventricosus]